MDQDERPAGPLDTSCSNPRKGRLDPTAVTAKAKAAYQDFLVLWKDADPDIPILKQAQAEYVSLR